ncbi:alkyl hydroperoxide reductase protein C [Bacteroides pyogenes JCM 6292]|uniref:Alkyl hydroperoxide reductase protein C n=1 Tax=Bacteroides pyogenes JCM 6292 TaxID=1235809 RepID=W4P6H4_9BACE|nr:alkyl hydroperoxide reductase protein C [Bacteroides pyogenes JCM 6292]
MEPILNSYLPEFSVQAFHNGAFKTVTNNDLKGKWAILFFYLPISRSYALPNWWIWPRNTNNSSRWA